MSVLILTVDEVMRTLSNDGQYPFVVNDKTVDIVRFALNTGFTDVVLDENSALRVMYQRPGESQVRAQTLTYHDTDGLRNYYDWHLLSADLTEKGTLTVALCILRADSEVEEWHTTPCQVRVLDSIHTDDSDEGDETITPTVKERVAVLESMIQRVASGAPIVVANASAMTDTDQIYVLSTDGNWYYHNGTAWVSGGEYGAVATDTTLTQSGKPADAKVVGDEVAGLKSAINNESDMMRDMLDITCNNQYLKYSQFVSGYYSKSGDTLVIHPSADYECTNVNGLPAGTYSFYNCARGGSYIEYISDNSLHTFTELGATTTHGTFEIQEPFNLYVSRGSSWENRSMFVDSSIIPSEYIEGLYNCKSSELDGKINKPSENPNGTNGQILQTNGDGTTIWINNDATEAKNELDKLNPDRVRMLLEYDIGKITLPNWGYYNLYSDGALQDYSTQKTRIATPNYYKSPYDIVIKNGNQTGDFILCTYHDDKTLDTRTTGLTIAKIPANTLFRICLNNGSDVITDIETYSNNIYYESKVYDRLNAIPQILQCFHKFTGIGDSLMAGYTSINGTIVSSADARNSKNNWFDYLVNKLNREGTNLAAGSSTTHAWRYADQTGVDINNANIDTDCYFVGLGVNDIAQGKTLGTQADINTSDITQCADSTYGNLYYILAKLHEFKPYAKIFVFTIPAYGTYNVKNINTAIAYCCSLIDNAFCVTLDADRFTVPFLKANNANGHYNPIAYAYMSGLIEDIVSAYIYEHYTDFVWIPYEH